MQGKRAVYDAMMGGGGMATASNKSGHQMTAQQCRVRKTKDNTLSIYFYHLISPLLILTQTKCKWLHQQPVHFLSLVGLGAATP
jgi:hypothetical protein